MGKKKILFFIYEMGAGGAARTLLNIINNLNRERFQPVLVTLNYNGSYESELKDDVTFIKLDTKRLSRSIFKLASIIRKENIDLVFSTIPRVNTIATLATFCSFTKCKNVVREADNLGGTFKENTQLLFFGLVYRMSSQVVSLSEGVKENLVSKYKLSRKRIKVIYNPVDLEKISVLKSEELDGSHDNIFRQGGKVILTAGRLVAQKDQATLIEAFRMLQKEVQSSLIILGEGPLKQDLEQQINSAGLSGKVHFLGFQKNPYKFISRADLFVLSSQHEGFSHVIAESIASGTIVVSTDCKSGPAEVLEGGKYGFLCEVGNSQEMSGKIIEALTLPEPEKQSMIKAGIQRAGTFDAKVIVKEYEAVFNEVLSKKKRR
ncbi:glycosyltransferase [Salipaludibacillus agaradhaerens]|uniref:glycosyltransferase n=1 Tax=Salipaludibacillus agaradhaerens TaxID=76935 RepID=UPI002151B91C|nr:glycosyltransferase [Salipaludibacillus agaradhaerens]MCR6108179.1 glycosyltransferase [Salipaludibacillus agaradhaerens]MCR6120204.1 glycosyltransferase [Salipaludibacillus agaradhaerens]